MSSRVLLLGATGRLGSWVARVARETPGVDPVVPERERADLARLSQEQWGALVLGARADVVLNAAAIAAVDRCEAEPELARAVNAEGPGRLAAACAELDRPLLHVSTDYVFGDLLRRGPGPYRESARRAPVQTYGATKAEGEARVLAAGWKVCVARVSWLFGPEGGAFPDFVLRQAKGGQDPVRVLPNQRSRPTFLPDLARWLLGVARALAEDAGGAGDRPPVPPILHAAGGPGASREDWARVLLDVAGFGGVSVAPQEDLPTSLIAARPPDSLLEAAASDRWASERGIAPIRDWRRAIEDSG